MSTLPPKRPSRVVIEQVEPAVDGGLFPIKRCPGEEVAVSAQIHSDGSDRLQAVTQHRSVKDRAWIETPMTVVNAGKDLWTARFVVDAPGEYVYTLQAWIDRFATWRHKLEKKSEAGQDIENELQEGAHLVGEAGTRASGGDAERLHQHAKALASAGGEAEARVAAALAPELASLMTRYPDRRDAVSGPLLKILVERERARTGAWYELFPRTRISYEGHPAPDAGPAGASFRQAEAYLPEIARIGFDVVYLPPIHPIGKSFRKGRNNQPNAGPDDPGSPWAIGSTDGGHKAVDPNLGTLKDFDHFVQSARGVGLEVALDLALQCSPDHPYVREHPEWFRHRPDGSIQYAENPPKKYEDIYPLDFECDAWQPLWQEIRSVVFFWAERGVLIFRVDNPHTKPFRFWEAPGGENVDDDECDHERIRGPYVPRVAAHVEEFGESGHHALTTSRIQLAERSRLNSSARRRTSSSAPKSSEKPRNIAEQRNEHVEGHRRFAELHHGRRLMQRVPPLHGIMNDRDVHDAHDREHGADAIRTLGVVDRRAQAHVAEKLKQQDQLEDDARIPFPVGAPHRARPTASPWRARRR